MSWLNEKALRNIRSILVTDDVSHLVMSPLKILLSKSRLISVTKLVFHDGIVPYVLALFQALHSPSDGAAANHSETKVLKLASGIWRSRSRFARASSPTRLANARPTRSFYHAGYPVIFIYKVFPCPTNVMSCLFEVAWAKVRSISIGALVLAVLIPFSTLIYIYICF